MMLCMARHESPSGSRFLFDLHRHHSVLVMRDETSKKPFSCIAKEGVTQGCVLAIIGCALPMMPMMRALKHDYGNCNSLWHTDDGSSIGNFNNALSFLNVCVKLVQRAVTFLKR